MDTVTMKDFLENIKKDNALSGLIPNGYGAGLPILSIRNKRLCIKLPYFKFIRVEEVDKSKIYPIEYVVTALWPTGTIIGYEALKYDEFYKNVDFTRPVGTFRHDAVKQYNSGQYYEKKDELYKMYDKVIAHLMENAAYTAEDEAEFKKLLNIIIEPSLKQMYKVLDTKFYNYFMN